MRLCVCSWCVYGWLCLGWLAGCGQELYGQELYPMQEPASSIPQGVWGVRLSSHLHYNYQTLAHRETLRLMYGATPKLSLMLSGMFSNFHTQSFPQDLNEYYRQSHHHQSEQSSYPYRFEGLHLYGKYRFVSNDGEHRHFRMAAFAEVAYNKGWHLDANPSLMGDQSGGSAGLILTQLVHKVAFSATGSVTHFLPYRQGTQLWGQAGRALQIQAGVGYLVFPRKYRNFEDVNINLYVEGRYKVYGRPVWIRDGYYLNINEFAYMRNGQQFSLYPSIQFIFNSTTRLDIVLEQPLYIAHALPKYTVFIVNVQKYFF